MTVPGKRLTLPLPGASEVVNVASVPQRSPFRYPGGKTWLVPHIRRWLSSLDSKPALLIEPFAGGAIVGLTAAFEDLAARVLLVEMDRDVAAVWQVVLNGKAEWLARRISNFEMTRQRVQTVLSSRCRRTEERAFATLLRNRVQHGGILAPGASLMRLGENGKGIASRWYPATLAKRIRAIVEVRDRVGFRKGDGMAVIAEYSENPGSAFFVDPPYTVAGRRLYRHAEMDHEALFALMSRVRGDFLMTYDYAAEVLEWARKFGFECKTVAMKSRQNSIKSELLIGKNLGWSAD